MISLKLKWTKYIPHEPRPKQMAFLLLPHLEALYGGAAGGGKSDALLMGALQYVDTPGFAAILFRKTLSDLKQPGALLDRSHEWLGGTDAEYRADEHCWYFPTKNPDGSPGIPARVQFGYIGEANAHTRYQSAEYQYVGWDELTQHFEDDYTYLFSRLRKKVCIKHPNRDDKGSPIYLDDCPLCQQQKSIPLRVRAATNPGGTGHRWVKERFGLVPHLPLDECAKLGIRPRYVGSYSTRPFIAAFLVDNPFIDQESYETGLSNLDKINRAQLQYGDWGISADSRFSQSWVKYYSDRGEYIVLGPDGHGPAHHMSSLQKIFVTIDPAASTKEGPGDTEAWRKAKSWTVMSVWGLTQDYNLLWLDMLRFRDEIPAIVDRMKYLRGKWRPNYFRIESNGLGMGVCQYALKSGFPVKPRARVTDKVVNATDAIVRMEQGKIWFPQYASWRKTAEDEVFTWTGRAPNLEEDDIVDTLADAVKEISWEAASAELADTIDLALGDDFPDLIWPHHVGPR